MKCIILAGGSGERLWPLSRTLLPKSSLAFFDDKTLLQNTYETVCNLTQSKNILIVTNILQEAEFKSQLAKYNKSPLIISEPMSKNTMSAVVSGLCFLENEKRDEVVVILPADFYIENKEIFKETIQKAKNIANTGKIVAIGTKPTYPEEGFGYIKKGEKIKSGFIVETFKEKPNSEKAKNFLESGDYFWNCGIYVSKISVLKETIKKYAPEFLKNFSKEIFDNNNKIKYRYYENLPSLSIDYALIEKCDNLAVMELKTQWSDVGSWLAIYNNSKKDKNGNVIKGNVITDNVKNSYIYSSKELVAVCDIKDTIVVETEDAVLICDKNKSRKINKIVSTLKNINNETTYSHKTVFRPWGFYTCLNEGKGWLTKIITVSPGHKLSLQSHNHRSEHWVVLQGVATIILEDEVHTLQKGRSIDIPLKAKHSLQNHTNEILKIMEVQKGDYINENDIIRYEDAYGRVTV